MFMELHLAVWKSGNHLARQENISAITSKSPSIAGYLYDESIV